MKPRDRNLQEYLGVLLSIGIFLLVVPTGRAADPVDDETCLACHEDYDRTLVNTTHRLSSQIENPAAQIACVSCHSGGSVHIEDPMVENIGNPATEENPEASRVCLSCHLPHQQMRTFGFDPHVGVDMKCTSCHSIHKGYNSLLADEQAGFCEQCHISVVNEFRKRSNHPLVGGNVSCISCHQFTGAVEPNFGHGGNAVCLDCHPVESGPFLFEHEATSSFSTEGEGCTACHYPHGSSNERLLKRTSDLLCQQCHMIGPAHLEVPHDGQFAGTPCLTCHSEVHGSNEPRNRFLLEPDLGAKLGGTLPSCYCHQEN